MLELRPCLLDCLRDADDFLWRHDGAVANAGLATNAGFASSSTPGVAFDHFRSRHQRGVHARDEVDDNESLSLRIGLTFLRHSSFLETIYSHFSSLEARKSKLKLTASHPSGPSAQLPVIADHPSANGAANAATGAAITNDAVPLDSSSTSFTVNPRLYSLFGSHPVASQPSPPDPCRRLNEAEWALFRHAYLVVSYPILGRPQPPPASPACEDEAGGGAGGGRRQSSRRFSSGLASSSSVDVDVDSFGQRPHHRHHAHHVNISSSSSMENDEADSIASIPEETLTELLRSIFGLSQESFVLHVQKIREKIGRKTVAKILAEELCNQLFVLENNRHPFYSPGAFLSRNAYDQWQQRQRIHINSLFQKFWYQALPNLR